MWTSSQVAKHCHIQYPIVQAGMAGSTTPELVAAVSNNGGLGTIGAGYMSATQLENEIIKVQQLTNQPFAVNLFVPEPIHYDMVHVQQMKHTLEPLRQSFGVSELKIKAHDDAEFEEKIALLLKYHVPICSFTFGIPSEHIIDKLKQASITTIGSATTVEEAQAVEQAGCDMVVAQGSEAGGHRGSFTSQAHTHLIGTMALVPQIVDHVSIPVIASGGIMDGRGVLASLALGASGVQMGTAFLTTTESKAADVHKTAIVNAKETDAVLTNVFSGKMARGLYNRFIEMMESTSVTPLPYPIQNDLTNDIRSAAKQKGDIEWTHLWSGQGVRLAQEMNAKQLITKLNREVQQRMHTLID